MNSTVIEYADNISRTCLSVCPKISTTTFYGDTSTGYPICVVICPTVPVLFGLNTTQICISKCPYGTYGDQTGNRTCIDQCPVISGNPDILWYGQIGIQLCVTLCATGTYGNNITRVCGAPTDCPLNTYADPSTNMCINTCPLIGWNYFGDPSTQTCVPICPNITKAVGSITVGISYSDYTTRTCVRSCPNTFGDNSTNNCVSKCPANTYAD
jgi:hypothetical protein